MVGRASTLALRCAPALALVASVGAAPAGDGPAPSGPGSPVSSTRVLVRLAPGVVASGRLTVGFADVDAALARHGVGGIEPALAFAPGDAELARALGLDRWIVVTVADGHAAAVAAELSDFADVFDSVEPDGVGGPADGLPDDPSFSMQWGMHNTGQEVPFLGAGTPGADIAAPAAWITTAGPRGLVLAVIDSGVDPHAELSGRMDIGWTTEKDGFGMGDQCGHGTHVAGIAAAAGNNGTGVAGVCWSARILPVRVIQHDCWGEESQLAGGIVWAADHGASVANISLQFYTGTQLLADAVEYAHARGMLMIAAAGNNEGDTVAYPAKFDHVMAVSATDNDDVRALFSNYGAEVDIAAPGSWIYSLIGVDGYKYMSGTSMASPHVAGLACLIWSVNPGLTGEEVAAIITGSADDRGEPGWDEEYGAGRINASAALVATPCYIDMDLDGVAAFGDYLAFQNAFQAGNPAADCDRSSGAGVFDLFDLLCFQNAFMAGCP